MGIAIFIESLKENQITQLLPVMLECAQGIYEHYVYESNSSIGIMGFHVRCRYECLLLGSTLSAICVKRSLAQVHYFVNILRDRNRRVGYLVTVSSSVENNYGSFLCPVYISF